MVALGRKEAATSMRRFCLLLAVSNPLWQPNLDFSSFRSVPSLSQQTRALKAAISAQIWKVSLVFKEKMISDSDETMIRRCAFLGYPHSSDHSTHLGPSVYVLIHFHPSLHASALSSSLQTQGRNRASVFAFTRWAALELGLLLVQTSRPPTSWFSPMSAFF